MEKVTSIGKTSLLLHIAGYCHIHELDLLREYARDPEAFNAWRRKHGLVEKEI